IVLYDSNDISLDGDLDRSFSDDTEKRFEAYGWQVIRVEDGNNNEALKEALLKAKENTSQPTLIEVKTIIGYGAPTKSNSNAEHCATLGEEEAKRTKEFYNMKHDPFHVEEEVYEDFRNKVQVKGEATEEAWNKLFAKYEKAFPEMAEELSLAIKGELPADWDAELPTFEAGVDEQAT